ncbi:probable E3 ubiquitin-protein ligase TRIML1 isoform X1 [Monodelphis domestica]|uniref:probable E3 ubiquitin-protein ligase TRIML1 isoform X1 n=1 Tax=Monodelphis domestica TaxID=13616 RepID=UPI0024E1FDD1|nr:probable E3 ubiquitin-protein ligase TRIML1 isoform X1 [Monodelphis domestica]XP_056664282.1 probable E3 ubiquitin-protein ligase TRIML1 isoform X1 [Monodelphis domestica]XP_056664283.1 probable E3 ubiquitin-protein ligase TRIML1 isoform X1 [Monodelphis domestica]XP_056664284.1 probable E3 ubiquitin-protein ligase TRIML1 isoform X1 [Monodelphis domestica]
MDARDLIESLKTDLTCSICLSYFTDPVTINCGHSFCTDCLLKYREGTDGTFNCPECRGLVKDSDLVPNRNLQNLSITGKMLRPHLLQSMVGLTLCEQHGEKQKYYCEEDEVLLCDSCFLELEHKNHTVLPLEMAADKCKDKLQDTLNLIQRREEEFKIALQRITNREELCKEDIYPLKQSVTSEYEKMHGFLWDEEQMHLNRLDREYKDNMIRLERNKDRITSKIRDLETMVLEVEDILDKGPLEMLQDMKVILEKNEEVLLQEPEVASPAWATSPITGLREMLMNFHRDITLDPDSANPHLILSEDLKSVKYGNVPQDLPDNRERFDYALIVLGTQTFSSGKHYWEVKVGEKTEWEVGISKESIRRKGKLSSLSQDVWILVSFKSGNDWFLGNSRDGLHLSQPIDKVGIFLDYDKGHIAFYDVIDKSLISSLSHTAFEGPLRPYFSPCRPNEESSPGSLIICHKSDK